MPVENRMYLCLFSRKAVSQVNDRERKKTVARIQRFDGSDLTGGVKRSLTADRAGLVPLEQRRIQRDFSIDCKGRTTE